MFINTLSPGDKFTRNGHDTVCTVVSRFSEAGRTSVRFTVEGVQGEFSFAAPGLTTVTKIGN
jgi:hypothetical protein